LVLMSLAVQPFFSMTVEEGVELRGGWGHAAQHCRLLQAPTFRHSPCPGEPFCDVDDWCRVWATLPDEASCLRDDGWRAIGGAFRVRAFLGVLGGRVHGVTVIGRLGCNGGIGALEFLEVFKESLGVGRVAGWDRRAGSIQGSHFFTGEEVLGEIFKVAKCLVGQEDVVAIIAKHEAQTMVDQVLMVSAEGRNDGLGILGLDEEWPSECLMLKTW